VDNPGFELSLKPYDAAYRCIMKDMVEDLVKVRVFRTEVHYFSDFALLGIVDVAANGPSRFVLQSHLSEKSPPFAVAHELKQPTQRTLLMGRPDRISAIRVRQECEKDSDVEWNALKRARVH
jgi:hypothetical protein